MSIFTEIKLWLSDKYNLTFLAVLLSALAIRIPYLFIESIWNDETFYLWYADNSLSNPSYWFSKTMFTNSFYSVMIPIAIFKLIVGDIVLAGRLATLIFSIAGLILVYLMGIELKSRLTGLIAAILLSVQPMYWLIGSKVLLDVPLTTSFLLAAFCFIKWLQFKNKFWSIALAVSMIIVIETKLSGLLIAPVLGIYGILSLSTLLLSKNHPLNKTRLLNLLKKKSTYIPFLILLLLLILLLIPYFIGSQIYYNQFISSPTGPISTAISMAKDFAERGAPYSESLFSLNKFFTSYINFFLAIGLIFMLVYRRKIDLIVISFAFYYIIYTVLTGGIVELRYGLPAIPFMILMVAFGLEESVHLVKTAVIKTEDKLHTNKKLAFAIIIIALLLAYPFYGAAERMFAAKSSNYLGYQEAGAWIRENVPSDAVIFAGSPGHIRLFSGYNFVNGTRNDEGKLDGNIYYGFKPDANLTGTPEMFVGFVKTLDKEIYLEVDIWEYSNQEWMYPLTKEKLTFLSKLGFKRVYTVFRDISTENGVIKMSVIIILKRDKPASAETSDK